VKIDPFLLLVAQRLGLSLFHMGEGVYPTC